MADVVIFPEQTLEFSVEGGVAQRVLIPAPFELIIGETYRVALDGVAHVATCVHVDGAPAITNIADPSNPDLPEDGSFLIVYLPPEIAEADGNSVAMVMCIDRSNAPTHTLAIYQTAAVSNDVITENWDGSTEVHPGVESVSLETEDGGEKEFILKDLVAEPVEKEVELDFSGGNMVVVPEDGQAFSAVNIPVPANLIPENIAEGVNIAGIIGALAAGGGMVVAGGTFTGNGGIYTLKHNMGVVPDFIYVECMSTIPGNTTYFIEGFAMSTAFKESSGYRRFGSIQAGNNYTQSESIETTNEKMFIRNANENTITIGRTNGNYSVYTYNAQHYWFAIGGLT